ncbi:MAG: sigma-70 family RNA polymerase sigma factor [Lentihominibacter sp.]|nr:sigma-70 family RNA polymerase sigma factor [Clostridiales bacterium]MDY2679358.1 sigma-70 family RNA polymerase sigma factor [Lentihominibacter sp.]
MAHEVFSSEVALAEALYKRYKNTMTAVAMSFMGNIHDAEDVVQLSMIKVIRNIDKIDDIDSDRCRHFIMVITKNTALNEKNKNKNRKTVTLDPSEMVNITGTCFEDYGIDDKYGFSEEMTALLSELRDVDKDILCLKYGDGYSCSEIGEITDLSETAVRQRLSRARKRLCEIIEEGGKPHHE